MLVHAIPDVVSPTLTKGIHKNIPSPATWLSKIEQWNVSNCPSTAVPRLLKTSCKH